MVGGVCACWKRSVGAMGAQVLTKTGHGPRRDKAEVELERTREQAVQLEPGGGSSPPNLPQCT